jgi:hypothetical protein
LKEVSQVVDTELLIDQDYNPFRTNEVNAYEKENEVAL